MVNRISPWVFKKLYVFLYLLIGRAGLYSHFSVPTPGIGNGHNPITTFAFQLYAITVEFCHQLAAVAPGLIVLGLRLNTSH